MSEAHVPHVYAAINAVQAELAKRGVAKLRRNQQQGYAFRGIDDVYNAISSIMAEHGLIILPRYKSRSVVERQSTKGAAVFSVIVDAEFDFVSVKDGSKHTVVIYGEAMDSGDKATNKAMSAAHKYACLQTFCIPTEGDNDADATTHEVASGSPRALAAKEAAEELSDLTKQVLWELARHMNTLDDADELLRHYKGENESGTGERLHAEKLFLWSQLDSKRRALIKRAVKGQAATKPLDDEAFAKRLEEWAALIRARSKTAQEIIAFASTKYALSDEQKAAILDVEAKTEGAQ